MCDGAQGDAQVLYSSIPSGKEVCPLTRDDWVLLAIAGHPDDQAQWVDPVRVMKILFMTQQELAPDGLDFRFGPYLYGPFTSEVYDSIASLAREGLVDTSPVAGRRWGVYKASAKGLSRLRELWARSSRAQDYLRAIRQWALAQSFADLLRVVYAKYPEFATKTVFEDR